MTKPHPSIMLASASPRRRELLALLGVPFDIRIANVDETPLAGEPPAEYPKRMSLLKARSVAETLAEGIVIGADTAVIHRGDILGKPTDAEQARAMLQRLRGERHRVISGVTVIDVATGKTITEACESIVHMRDMSDAEIDAYIASGDPMDKAGAYAVQNTTFAPVQKVVGCPANVMGLPVCHVVRNLRRLGVPLPDTPPTRCDIRYGYHCAITNYVMPDVEQQT
nr:Maf family protein [Ardenticatena sp.]